jgi:hypothetical protein
MPEPAPVTKATWPGKSQVGFAGVFSWWTEWPDGFRTASMSLRWSAVMPGTERRGCRG